MYRTPRATPRNRRMADSARDPSLAYESSCFSAGAAAVIGVDEVGRGAIAGPVAVGAHVVLAGTAAFPTGLRDSKLLSEKRRETLAPLVAEWGAGAVGYASAEEIDAHGIVWALGAAGRRALLALHEAGAPVELAVVLVDGKHDWLTPALRRPLNVRTQVGADRACVSVAAASVRAKVERDALMRAADAEHPGYAWAANKGYGAQAHYAGIAAQGLSPLHRRSFIH